ncbi:hypothetical protein JQN42_13660 [Escherichia coli]|uniref:hypothetical protein n=1 Tax=Escherichia coli TaxID=562 RepID=UPI0017A252C6|nr:hypothetical protein [Escherichia coli]EFB9774956.1 hypothetical protein [Escherichia coli]EHX1350091.1 hypothetical protein [Escherichia coli]ELC3354748.1 hypothetical protein [Escherichia coli]MBM1029468.1 hypothetical protein [Escherichia coli]
MDLLEASAQLERIELLAKIAHVYESNQREKTIALAWIGELAGEVREMVKKEGQRPQNGGISSGGSRFQ